MQNYQILVCEDEVEIGNAIEIYLKNQGYGVHRAYNGKEGLEVLGPSDDSSGDRRSDDAGHGRADDDHDTAAEL